MNLMKVKFKWRTAYLDLDPNEQAANDETDVRATEAPRGIVRLVNTFCLYHNSKTGYWYVNEEQTGTWWPHQGDTTFKVRVKKNGFFNEVLWKSSGWVHIDPIYVEPPGVTLKSTCTIEDGSEPGAPPGPCRWVVQGGTAYKIC